MSKGLLIAIYGINNLGKSTQACMLRDRIEKMGVDVKYLKYPLYDLEPTGPVINGYLRGGNPFDLDPTGFQIIQTTNRIHYEPTLRSDLASGTHVVVEDYRGTGIAWGLGTGVSRELLFRLNEPLAAEDVSILLDGERFLESREEGHVYENKDDLTARVRSIHLELAEEFGWIVLLANQSREAIHKEIWEIVAPRIEAAA